MARWNHNIEYHRLISEALREVGPSEVLDVGCGDGVLAAALAPLCGRVTGLDPDLASLERARAEVSSPDVRFVAGDLMADPFAPATFDAVVSVAALHHMDEGAALVRMASLLRPGGVLAVVGLARSSLPADLPWELAGAVTTRILRRRHGGIWETQAPKVWPPPSTHRQIRRIARGCLPGVRHRRHVLWRYSLVWQRPVDPTPDAASLRA